MKSRIEITTAEIADLFWNSAIKALGVTIGLVVLGKVAVGLLSGLLGQMTPSLPPVSPQWHNVESAAQATSPAWGHSLRKHQFGLLYGMVFLGISGLRLTQYSENHFIRLAACRLMKVTRNIYRHWFKVLVVNAFVAFGSSMGLYWAQQFSGPQLAIHQLLEWFHPLIYGVIRIIMEARLIETAQGLIHWYDANQLKFLFWGLYLAAIADDLGLPNYKTLLRLLWLRLTSKPSNSMAQTRLPNDKMTNR